MLLTQTGVAAHRRMHVLWTLVQCQFTGTLFCSEVVVDSATSKLGHRHHNHNEDEKNSKKKMFDHTIKMLSFK